MSNSVKELTQKLEQARTKLDALKKRISTKQRQLTSMLAHAEQEIARLTGEPATVRRDHLLELYELRRQLVLRSQQVLEEFSNLDPSLIATPNFVAAHQSKAAVLDAEAKCLGLAYSITNYRPIAKAIARALEQGADSAKTGPLQRASGPLGASRPGTGRLGAPSGPLGRPGTGPLGAPPPGPLGARPATGPLGARKPGGTGPMAKGSGPLRSGNDLDAALPATTHEALAKASVNPQRKAELQKLLKQFQDVEASLAEILGAEPGTLVLPAAEAIGKANKIAGQVYYVKRTIDGMPDLAPMIGFEPDVEDAALQRFMAENQITASAPAESGTLSDKLKSFFNLG